MAEEWKAFQKLTPQEHQWFQVWVRQIEAIDRKASAMVTLDGLLLALTAAFLASSPGSTSPTYFRILFGAGTLLILLSAAASVSSLWVRRFLSERLAQLGNIEEASESFARQRASKSRTLQVSIVGLVFGLSSYAVAILVLLAR